MTDLPVILHGVRLYIRNDEVMAEVMASQRRVAMSGHPSCATVRDVSVDSVAEIWAAAATPEAVFVHCCITGAAIRRVAIVNAVLVAVSSSAVLAFARGDSAHFVLWVPGSDQQIFGSDPTVTSLALGESSLATQALIGMSSGAVLLMSVLFGLADWQPVCTVAPAVPTQVIAVPGGIIVVGNGGLETATLHVQNGHRAVQTVAAPLATHITAVQHAAPWVVCSDGSAWNMGRPGQRVGGALRGVYAGCAGVVACGAGGLTYWPAN